MKFKIFKIGQYLEYFTSGERSEKPLLLIFSKPDPPIGYYTEVLRKASKERYNFLRTNGIIRQDIGYSYGFYDLIEFPKIGDCFNIGDKGWKTTKVTDIISESIFITENSVYAIHNIELYRRQRFIYYPYIC